MKNPAENGVSAGFFSVCMSGLADLYDGIHADLDSLLVHRDKVVVTGREGLLQSGCHVLHLHDGLNLQEGSEHDHVVSLGVAQLGSLVSGIDLIEIRNKEYADLRSNFLIANNPKSRTIPKAFTEKGLYMLATILKGERAVEGTVEDNR